MDSKQPTSPQLRLTIAIPTFDRNETLIRNLRRLVPQIRGREAVELLVVDNASPRPVEPDIRHEFGNLPEITIRRNEYNVGLSGNILKCVEHSKGEWMWLLGDDDTPLDRAVDRILGDIGKRPGFMFINYANRQWTESRSASFDTSGLEELVRKMDSFQNFLFISSGVFNLAQLVTGLRYASLFGYTLAPHTALVFSQVGSSGKIHFSAEEVVGWGKADKGEKWSMIPLSLGIMNLLNLPLRPLSDEGYLILSRKLGSHTLSGRAALANILHYADDFSSFEQARYAYHLIAAYRLNAVAWTQRFESWLFGWAFCSRRIFGWIRWIYLQSRGWGFQSPSRFNRI